MKKFFTKTIDLCGANAGEFSDSSRPRIKTACIPPERIASTQVRRILTQAKPVFPAKTRIAVAQEGRIQKRRRDSDGKLVNVGKFDSDGVNVNSNRPDNSNDNLGVAFSRSLCLALIGRGFLISNFLPNRLAFCQVLPAKPKA